MAAASSASNRSTRRHAVARDADRAHRGLRDPPRRLDARAGPRSATTWASKLILGEPGGANSPRTKRIADALTRAGFEIVVTDTIEKEFWVKLLGNVSFNPVSALTGAPPTG